MTNQQQPWAPQPPPKKPAPWKLITGITAAVVLLCCGGFLAIGIFADPPAEETRPDSTAAPLAAPVAASSAPAAPETSLPAVGDDPASSSPAVKRSSPAAAKSKSPSPTPKKTTRKPKPKPTTQEPEPEPEDEPEEDVYYANCTEVREAGAAPIRRGDPGYRRALDRDGDGEGCAGN